LNSTTTPSLLSSGASRANRPATRIGQTRYQPREFWLGPEIAQHCRGCRPGVRRLAASSLTKPTPRDSFFRHSSRAVALHRHQVYRTSHTSAGAELVRNVQLAWRKGCAGTGQARQNPDCGSVHRRAYPNRFVRGSRPASHGSVIGVHLAPPELWRRAHDVPRRRGGGRLAPAAGGPPRRLRLDRFPEGCVLFGFAVARNAREGY
jgi:hypothetical protein